MAEKHDWHNLNHAYGKAGDILQLLELLSPDKNAEVWDELWSRICHQGTVYSASFQALPYLLEAARRWPPANRVMPLCLAAAIVISDDVAGPRDTFMESLSPVVEQCLKLTLETLNTAGLSREHRIYLMETALAFKGDAVWGRTLNRFVDGELQGVCPNCNAYLYVVIGKDGFFVTADEWIKKLPADRTTVEPANPNELRDAGLWLHKQCIKDGDLELAGWICNTFGSTTCPSCGAVQNIPDILAHYYEQ